MILLWGNKRLSSARLPERQLVSVPVVSCDIAVAPSFLLTVYVCNAVQHGSCPINRAASGTLLHAHEALAEARRLSR
jgi:hypothetical protein